MAKSKVKKVPVKDISMPIGQRKINPRGATVLTNLPKSKKKVGIYGLI